MRRLIIIMGIFFIFLSILQAKSIKIYGYGVSYEDESQDKMANNAIKASRAEINKYILFMLTGASIKKMINSAGESYYYPSTQNLANNRFDIKYKELSKLYFRSEIVINSDDIKRPKDYKTLEFKLRYDKKFDKNSAKYLKDYNSYLNNEIYKRIFDEARMALAGDIAEVGFEYLLISVVQKKSKATIYVEYKVSSLQYRVSK